MSSFNAITALGLSDLIGTNQAPTLIDVRIDEDFDANPRMIPGAIRRPYADVHAWSASLSGRVIVICHKGKKLSEGTAAWLRAHGIAANILEGGFVGWEEARLPTVPFARTPARDASGRTVWVTRSRPKIDRIACPWLIRRFIDPGAVFLYVAVGEVTAVAERFNATPFDIDDVHFSHRGERCTFDVMVEEFGLATPPLARLATIIRGADTGRLDLAPEAPGLLAASLGLSCMYGDDLQQLEAGLTLYDAFYRWCRDAEGETHAWNAKPASTAV